MINKKLLVLTPLLFVLSGCADMDTALKSVNNTLASTNDALSGIQQQDVSKVIKDLPNQEAVTDMQEALPTVNKALSMIACAPKNAYANLSYQNRVMRYATTDSSNQMIYLPGAGTGMPNHRSGCLNIERVDSYRQIAKNAFSFNAQYVSPQSEETKNVQYHMIKEPSGEWLFKF